MAYEIIYSPEAEEHLLAFSARNRCIILDVIEEQLTHQPGAPTQNRKLLRPNVLATWELRIGEFRVYYDLEKTLGHRVHVIAIGVKDRSQVRVGGKVYRL